MPMSKLLHVHYEERTGDPFVRFIFFIWIGQGVRRIRCHGQDLILVLDWSRRSDNNNIIADGNKTSADKNRPMEKDVVRDVVVVVVVGTSADKEKRKQGNQNGALSQSNRFPFGSKKK